MKNQFQRDKNLNHEWKKNRKHQNIIWLNKHTRRCSTHLQLGEYKLKQNEIALHTQEMGNFLNLRKLSVGMIVEYWVLT